MWMGGVVPVGYRVDAAAARRAGAPHLRAHPPNASGPPTWRAGWPLSASPRAGTPFSKQALWKLLNTIYRRDRRGSCKGQVFRGQHEVIIDSALWDTHSRADQRLPRAGVHFGTLASGPSASNAVRRFVCRQAQTPSTVMVEGVGG